MYVVLGANGRAGGEVARALIQGGEAVRVVVRRKEQGETWAALGAEVAVASIEDVDAMAGALAGAEGAFLLNPPPVSGDPLALTQANGAALAAAARRAHLPKAVVLSSIGAQHVSGTGVIATLNRLEALLDGIAPATAFLRPSYFIENWGEVADAVLSEGVLPSFIEPSLKMPMVSTIDIGHAAASVLAETWTGKRVVELEGPELSAGDVASAFADIVGRPVKPVFVPPEGRAAVLAGAGVSRVVADALLGMYEGIANGLLVHQEGNERRHGATPLATAIQRLLPAARSEAA